MATPISSVSPTMKCFLYAYFVCLCLLFSLEKGYALEGRKVAESHHSHSIEVSSLLPSASCKPSTKVLSNNDNKASLKVVHKHGPCSELSQDEASAAPTHTEILLQDQSRVKSIHSRLSNSKTSGGKDVKVVTDATTIPAKDGSTVGSGNYIVTVGLGTPKKDLSLIFDTGSDITWTQCQPCARSCYKQKEQIFDPSQSTSYTNISCSSSICNSLTSATGNTPGCASSACVYGIQYGDSSFSVGFFGTEKLTLTSTDAFNNIYFGCGQNNQGLFGGAAGLLGLGRDKLSVVSQTAQKYNKIFSYCLPSSSSSTGFLTFGGSASKNAKFTPLSTISAGPSFYGLDFTGMSVGGKKLAISASAFSTAGAIIDSGTVISRLPPAAYSALRASFRNLMSKYPMTKALSILDTCYDFSNYTTISVPKIGFFFSSGIEVDIDATGILYASSLSQVCLAFAGNNDATDVFIFGNVQQKTLEVFYDGSAGKVGFAPGGCS
ncbi:aspartyl protease family protein [Populus alba x Populus x berolinensis]|uniref:Aspartyl protease family protein n=1 Tax=Populus alba x Populus x berolinensis TaxID=444605 RepID=A0AAD6LBT6_9ROSI|nr:aspartyl protease family protein [Populus alba x Populus x berolinensis]